MPSTCNTSIKQPISLYATTSEKFCIQCKGFLLRYSGVKHCGHMCSIKLDFQANNMASDFLIFAHSLYILGCRKRTMRVMAVQWSVLI